MISMNGGLINQADLLVISLEAGFENLLEHIGRLAGIFIGQHILLTLDHSRIQACGIKRQRCSGCHMQGDQTAQS